MSGTGRREEGPQSNRDGSIESGLTRTPGHMGSLESRLETFLRSNVAFGIVLAGLAGAVTALRLSVALASPVVGPDYGHYLIAANWYLGQDRSGEGPFDPPFLPLLFIGLSPILGKIQALQLLGAISAASILPAAAILMERFVPRWISILGATVFALWDGFTDFITFGGVTNLFGIAISLVFLRVFFSVLEAPRPGLRPRRSEVIAALLAFCVVSVHHLTAFVTGSTVLLWVGLRILLDRDGRRAVAWTTSRVTGMAVAMSSIYAPYLFDVTTNDVAGGLGTPFPASGIGVLIGLTWRYTPLLWLAILLLGLLAFVRFDRRATLAPFAVALLLTPILLVLTVLSSHPVRGLYFEQFPIVFVAALWGAPATSRFLPRRLPDVTLPVFRALCVGLLLLSAPLLAIGAPDVQRAGMELSHDFMNPGTLAAFDWVRENTNPDDVVAVDGAISPQFNENRKGTGLGWWLEGYANRRAIYEAHPVFLISQSKWEDARDANRLFSADTVFEDGTLRVADGFPADDGASPMIYSAFLQDYHELAGLAAPRIIDLEDLPAYPLILAANQSVRRELGGQTGVIAGTYSGPGFSGNRTMRYDGSRRTAELEMHVTVESGSGWDGIEVTVRLPPRTIFDLGAVGAGRIDFDVATFPGSPSERGFVQFVSSNLSGIYVTEAPDGIGLRWVRTGPSFALHAELSFAYLISPSCEGCPLIVRTSSEILRARSVDLIFVPVDSSWNVRRLDRQPALYHRVFSNLAVIIYEVNETKP